VGIICGQSHKCRVHRLIWKGESMLINGKSRSFLCDIIAFPEEKKQSWLVLCTILS